MSKEVKGAFSPDAQKARDAFLAHKREHPEPTPYEELTPLQKRMQSGGMPVRQHHDPGLGHKPTTES
jgi:hypothetical protein